VTYVIRQVLSMLVVLLIVSLITFSLMHLMPGDPALAILGTEATSEQVSALRQELGLEQPLLVQYARWLGSAVRGDLGRSIRTRQDIGGAVLNHLKPTLQLVLFSATLAVIVGIPVGMIAAVRRNSLLDTFGTTVAMAGIAMPNFFLGILLILVFSVWLGWLPAIGYVDPFQDLTGNLRRMVLPTIALSASLTAEVLRQTRSSLLETLQEDYIRTARSYGIHEAVIVRRHALRNALMPVVTVVGMNVGRLFGGAVVTEFVFGIPGIGRLALDSVLKHDYPMVQGIVLVMAVGVLVSYLLVDFVYAYLDPRIQFS
jgi:peptide/nickel transport system permease protein